jgi:hypothetical protein
MTWKITDIQATDGLITSAKYYVSLEKDGYSADTEGYWHFVEPTLKTPFDQVTEEMVIDWVKGESKSQIEDRLNAQIENLKAERKTVAPWMPQVFTPEV